MRFDDADHRIAEFQLAAARLRQHLVGLADAGGRAEKNLETATPFLARLRQQGIWRGAGRVVGHSLG